LSCPLKQLGVKCFDCLDRETCVQLNPPKSKPKLYESPCQEHQTFQPLPMENLDKSLYRMLLLMCDDFMLTAPEKRELIFLASKFKPFSKSGGRGKSKERVYAYLCLHLLERDGRGIIVSKNEDFYTDRYKLDLPDKDKMQAFVLSEIKRILK